MRILLLAHAPSVHTQRWAGALAARGHDVRLLSVDAAPGSAFPGESIGSPGAPLPFLRYLGARGAVARAIESWRPAVVVAHFIPNYGFLAARAGARPLVIVAWGSDLLVNARRTPLHAARARWTLGRAAWLHVDAENAAAAARSLGMPPERIWTRPWGVDADALAPVRPWGERARGAGGLRILWTRMLEPIYDPSTFVRALVLLRRDHADLRATIAGDGSLMATLRATVRAEGLEGAVRFEGLVDEARLRALYREHEVYVSMSRSDSTSQSLLEAMAAGLYPVVSDIPGNREWIGTPPPDGDARAERGTLAPLGDAAALARAVAAVASDPDADARVARGVSLVRAKASWAETVAQTEARLLGLVDRASPGPRGGA